MKYLDNFYRSDLVSVEEEFAESVAALLGGNGDICTSGVDRIQGSSKILSAFGAVGFVHVTGDGRLVHFVLRAGDKLFGGSDEQDTLRATLGTGDGSIAGFSSGNNQALTGVVDVAGAVSSRILGSTTGSLSSLDSESNRVDLHSGFRQVVQTLRDIRILNSELFGSDKCAHEANSK